jgi:hypothetical protein
MTDIPEKRSIRINPDLFKFPTANSTRKKREPGQNTPNIKVRGTPQEKNSKTLKRNLLKYIRRQQDQLHKETAKKDKYETNKTDIVDVTTPSTSHDFKDSLDYLLKLTKETENRQKTTPKQHTLKHRTNLDVSDILNHINVSIPTTNEMVSLEMHIGLNQSHAHITQNYPRKIATTEPQYGCLKNGNKPTFRSWKNHTQRANPTLPTNINSTQQMIPSNIDPTSQRIQNIQQRSKINRINQLASSPEPKRNVGESQKFSDILKREQMKQMKTLNVPKKIKRPKQCQKTMRRTYRVGRSKVAPRISVLVSNRTIRKNVTTQAQLLKQTPMKDVKQYLIKHGFIRIGSIAPNEVLRRMFETAKMMCGEVHNHNPENVLYNFLNGEGEP